MNKALTVAGVIVAVAGGIAGSGAHSHKANSVFRSVNPTDQKVKSPVNNTWYWLGDKLTISTPGKYRLSYTVMTYSSRLDTGTTEAIVTLSTKQDGSVIDRLFNRAWRQRAKGTAGAEILQASNDVVINVPTTYYLLIKQSSGSNWDTLQFLGENADIGTPTVIQAEYLGA